MKLTKNNLTSKLGIKDEEIINLITTYQKQLPILSEEGEGFCVNARNLYDTLCIKDAFSTWINNNLNSLDMQNSVDYSVWFKQNATSFDEKEIEMMSSQKRSSYGISVEYNLTMDCAKQISMVIGVLPRVNQQTKELSKISRRYFIMVEKILKDAVKWEKIRKPEKTRYKELCQELKGYMNRNLNKEPMNYDFMNEANMLNKICLGADAKHIRAYVEAQDENTRDWLEIKYNEYLDKMQELDIMYLKMNMDKTRRCDLIQQGFKALYPNASFLIINSGNVKES